MELRGDPLRQLRRRVDRVLHVSAHLLQERLGRRGIGVERGLRELKSHGERHQVLLHAAVELPLDAAAVGVGGADEPCPRRAQLGELRVQALDVVVIGQRDLPSWVGGSCPRSRARRQAEKPASAKKAATGFIHLLPP